MIVTTVHVWYIIRVNKHDIRGGWHLRCSSHFDSIIPYFLHGVGQNLCLTYYTMNIILMAVLSYLP